MFDRNNILREVVIKGYHGSTLDTMVTDTINYLKMNPIEKGYFQLVVKV